MDDKNMIVDIYNKKYKKEKILNENNNECLICYKIMNDNNKIILINNYCNCFFAILLCEECFLNWLLKSNRCFVCRKRLYDDNNKTKYYNILNKLLLVKMKEKLETTRVNIIMDIVEINRNTQFEGDSLKIFRRLSIFLVIFGSLFLLVFTIIPKIFNIKIL